MKQFRCKECGGLFAVGMNYCPGCGCPATVCETVDDGVPPPLDDEMPPPPPIDGVAGEKKMGTGRENVQKPPQQPNFIIPEKKKNYFEITCYCLAGICGLLFLLTATTNGGYVNFDGSNTALRHEIAAFGWLIVGRLTALINK